VAEHLVEDCTTCGAPIIRAVHERTLKPSVIDAAASPAGNVILLPPLAAGLPLYRVLKVAEQFGRQDLHTSHFATCPQAASWRRRSSQWSGIG
jgi:hypothetical protein